MKLLSFYQLNVTNEMVMNKILKLNKGSRVQKSKHKKLKAFTNNKRNRQ